MAKHNTSKVVRVADRSKNFSIIPNDIAQSIVLTPTEKSLLIHLLSMPDNWYYVKTQFWKRTNMGRDACYKAWDSLTERGYITQTKIIQNNLIVGYHYEISDIPKVGHTDIQTNRNSVCNKRTKLTKNKDTKKDIQKEVLAISLEAEELGVLNSLDKPTLFQIKNGLV
jgi:hypothetical protein